MCKYLRWHVKDKLRFIRNLNNSISVFYGPTMTHWINGKCADFMDGLCTSNYNWHSFFSKYFRWKFYLHILSQQFDMFGAPPVLHSRNFTLTDVTRTYKLQRRRSQVIFWLQWFMNYQAKRLGKSFLVTFSHELTRSRGTHQILTHESLPHGRGSLMSIRL